jgi:transcriptional regulator with XRE-family HTH domain
MIVFCEAALWLARREYALRASRHTLRSIAANVRRIRLQRRLTQEQLAEAASLEARTIQTLEAGDTNPSAAVLVVVSDALGVKPGALFLPARVATRAVGRPRKAAAARRPTR